MARPKKKPAYDSDQMAQQIMEAVTDAYLNPPQGMEDDAGHMQLNQLAEEFSMTPLKVRKLLITTGAYQTAISKAVNALFREGKSVAEIQELTNLSRASVQSYLPYSKTVYKMAERTLWRSGCKNIAVGKLQQTGLRKRWHRKQKRDWRSCCGTR